MVTAVRNISRVYRGFCTSLLLSIGEFQRGMDASLIRLGPWRSGKTPPLVGGSTRSRKQQHPVPCCCPSLSRCRSKLATAQASSVGPSDPQRKELGQQHATGSFHFQERVNISTSRGCLSRVFEQVLTTFVEASSCIGKGHQLELSPVAIASEKNLFIGELNRGIDARSTRPVQ